MDKNMSIEHIDLENLSKVKKIGEGTYGIVYTAQRVQKRAKARAPVGESIKVAVKRNMVDDTVDFVGSIKEADLLHRLKGHPHIVNLYAVSFGDPFVGGGRQMSPLRKKSLKDDNLHFLFEHAKYDLHTLIHEREPMYYLMKKCMLDVLLGVEFMHSRGVIHRDLKPGNVLVCLDSDEEIVFKICDFGLAKPYTQQGPQSPRVVTTWYRAPEVCLGWKDYTTKTDIWSVGCIFFEIMAQKAWLNKIQDRDSALYQAILNKLPQKPSAKSMRKLHKGVKHKFMTDAIRMSWKQQIALNRSSVEEFNEAEPSEDATYDNFILLLNGLLSYDPDDRLTASQALDADFFKGSTSYIQKVRGMYPIDKSKDYTMNIKDCIERKWAAHIILKLYGKKSYSWYKDRTLFQALDIYDRYLDYAFREAEKNNPFFEKLQETPDKGRLLSKFEAELRLYVCLYVAIKYFTSLDRSIPFSDLVTGKYASEEAYIIAEDFETTLLRDILQFDIYRDTLYEVADQYDEKLLVSDVRDLLKVFCILTSCDGLLLSKVYEMYRSAHEENET